MKKTANTIIWLFVVYFALLFFYLCFTQLKISNVHMFEKGNREAFEQGRKICVIYNYYEKDEMYKENFSYFLNHGIYDEVDYYIIVNGKSSVEIPKRPNIFIHYRENKGYDFGAFSYIIHNKLNKEYDYYCFINTSVKGPFLKDGTKKWYEHFLELFKENVHIVGTSINICTLFKPAVIPHVQSMFFIIDKMYFDELKKEDFFNEEEINNMSFNDIIQKKEIRISQIGIEKGYNINCILSKYRDLDYLSVDKDINPTSISGDPYYNGAYFGETIDPYEVIFFKANRSLSGLSE